MFKVFQGLKDKKNPLVGPTHYNIQFWGLMLKDNRKFYYTIHVCAIIFVITQYIELVNIRHDLQLAMRNLSVTMLSTVCVVKASTFVIWEDSWMELINYITNLEKLQLSKNDPITNNTIDEYSQYSKRITQFYKALTSATVTLVITAPMFCYLTSSDYQSQIKNGSLPYPEILSAWVPFDRTKGSGYWITVIIHCVICCYGGSIVANFDCNAVVIMSFFAGQLKLLSFNCARLFNADDFEATKRIKNCHFHHVNIIKYTGVLNSLLSPIMFLYVIICSLMICASAIQLTTESTSNMQRVWIAEYLMALIAQLFLYCWHSNEVLNMSDIVDDGVYRSTWYTQNVCVRRNILLLGGQLRKKIMFTASPFTNLNVATFVAILKGSYSYYTFLDNKEK